MTPTFFKPAAENRWRRAFPPGVPLRRGGGAPLRGASREGFTLLEVMMAIAIAAALMVAANFFVLSMGELWGRGSDDRLFDQHVRGVTRFLEDFVRQAVVPTEPAATGAGTGTNGGNRGRPSTMRPHSPRSPAFGWGDSGGVPTVRLASARGGEMHFLAQTAPGGPRRTAAPGPGAPSGGKTPRPPGGPVAVPKTGDAAMPPGGPTATDLPPAGDRFVFGTPFGYDGTPDMLMFEVDGAPGVCVWPTRPLPQVQCALQITADEGLVLLWKSRLEEDFDSARPRKTLLSPFVRSLAFEYFDADRNQWSRSEQPIVDTNREMLVPQRLRLVFGYKEMVREVSIALPSGLEGPPLR